MLLRSGLRPAMPGFEFSRECRIAFRWKKWCSSWIHMIRGWVKLAPAVLQRWLSRFYCFVLSSPAKPQYGTTINANGMTKRMKPKNNPKRKRLIWIEIHSLDLVTFNQNSDVVFWERDKPDGEDPWAWGRSYKYAAAGNIDIGFLWTFKEVSPNNHPKWALGGRILSVLERDPKGLFIMWQSIYNISSIPRSRRPTMQFQWRIRTEVSRVM